MANDQEPIESGNGNTEATNALRRKLLKGGGAALPVMISLQSGTAWAISSCASEISRPSNGNMTSTFGPSNNPNDNNRDLVESITGISRSDIDDAIDDDFSAAGGDYPESAPDDIQQAEVMHLFVTNGSCWVSFCDGPVDIGGVTFSDSITPDACNGS